MKKGSINAICNYGDVNLYGIKNQKNVHAIVCKFLKELGFDDEEIHKVNIPFEKLNDKYVYIMSKNYEVHLFFRGKSIDLVIKTKDREKLHKIMKSFFIFPGKIDKYL